MNTKLFTGVTPQAMHAEYSKWLENIGALTYVTTSNGFDPVAEQKHFMVVTYQK